MVNPRPPQFPEDSTLAQALRQLASKWGWFVGLGIILLILGVIASLHVLMAAVVSVWFVGLMMIVGGVAQLVHAWRSEERRVGKTVEAGGGGESRKSVAVSAGEDTTT